MTDVEIKALVAETIKVETAPLIERIKELEDGSTKTLVWQAENGLYIKQILGSMDELKSVLRELQDKPQKRWDAVIAAIISSVIGAIVGGIVAVVKFAK